MSKPFIRANGGDPGVKASVSASSSVTLTLDSIVGVRSVQWIVLSTDETAETTDYTLTPSGSIGQTATFTSLGEGTAVLVKVVVNSGLVKGLPNLEETSNTIKVFVPTSDGLEVGAAGETYESDATHGTTGILNQPIRILNGLSTLVYSTDYKKAVACAISNTAITGNPSPMDGVTIANLDVVLLVGQTAPAQNGLWVVNTGGAWTRPSNFTTNAAVQGCFVAVVKGTLRKGWIFQNTNTNAITVDTTSLTFDRVADRFDRADLALASSTPDANILTRYGASSELRAAYFRSNEASVGTSGVVRTADGQVLWSSRDDADANTVELISWGATTDEMDLGSTFADAINFSVKATKTFRWKDDGTSFATLTKAGGMILSGTGGFVGPYFATTSTPVATTGLVRATNSQNVVVVRNDADDADVPILSWGMANTDEVELGYSSNATVRISVKSTGDVEFNEAGAPMQVFSRSGGMAFDEASTFAISHAVGAGAGANATISAQNGANTFDGGKMTVAAGDPGAGGNPQGIDLQVRSGATYSGSLYVKGGAYGNLLAVQYVVADTQTTLAIGPTKGKISVGDELRIAATSLNLDKTPSVQAPTESSVSGATVLDFASSGDGPKVELTLTNNTTLSNPSNVVKGARYQVKIINGAGPYTVTWGANWKFGGVPSAVTAVAGAIDIFEFEGDSGGIVRLLLASMSVHV